MDATPEFNSQVLEGEREGKGRSRRIPHLCVALFSAAAGGRNVGSHLPLGFSKFADFNEELSPRKLWLTVLRLPINSRIILNLTKCPHFTEKHYRALAKCAKSRNDTAGRGDMGGEESSRNRERGLSVGVVMGGEQSYTNGGRGSVVRAVMGSG